MDNNPTHPKQEESLKQADISAAIQIAIEALSALSSNTNEEQEQIEALDAIKVLRQLESRTPTNTGAEIEAAFMRGRESLKEDTIWALAKKATKKEMKAEIEKAFNAGRTAINNAYGDEVVTTDWDDEAWTVKYPTFADYELSKQSKGSE